MTINTLDIPSLEDNFLSACKEGNMMLLMLTIQQKVNINCRAGYGLRRAIRYNQTRVVQYLVGKSETQVNLRNNHGQTALHTAARFNIPTAVTALLNRPDIDVNTKSKLGSTPVMVAAKYASKEALQILVDDDRVDMNTVDNSQRKITYMVGAAVVVVDTTVRDAVLAILNNRARKPSMVPEFNLDEGYLTTSSTGSDRPIKA